jgi:hypothetical protein
MIHGRSVRLANDDNYCLNDYGGNAYGNVDSTDGGLG